MGKTIRVYQTPRFVNMFGNLFPPHYASGRPFGTPRIYNPYEYHHEEKKRSRFAKRGTRHYNRQLIGQAVKKNDIEDLEVKIMKYQRTRGWLTH